MEQSALKKPGTLEEYAQRIENLKGFEMERIDSLLSSGALFDPDKPGGEIALIRSTRKGLADEAAQRFGVELPWK